MTLPMTMTRAVEILGVSATQTAINSMRVALQLGRNNAVEAERLEAAKFVLRRWKAYQAACNAYRDALFARR